MIQYCSNNLNVAYNHKTILILKLAKQIIIRGYLLLESLAVL